MGRYAERVNTTLRFMMKYDDQLIDGHPIDFHVICDRLSMPDIYTSDDDFVARFTFDEDNPDSIYTAADRMLGNGMMLRETISSVKCGWTAERCVLYLRLGEPDRLCLAEISKFISRVQRTPVRTRSFAYAELLKATVVGEGGTLPDERGDLIHAAEELVEI